MKNIASIVGISITAWKTRQSRIQYATPDITIKDRVNNTGGIFPKVGRYRGTKYSDTNTRGGR